MATQAFRDPRNIEARVPQPVDQTALIQGEVVIACYHGGSSSSVLSGLKTTLVAIRDRIHPLTHKHRRSCIMLKMMRVVALFDARLGVDVQFLPQPVVK